MILVRCAQARTVPRTNGGGNLGNFFGGSIFIAKIEFGGHLGGGGVFYCRKLIFRGPRGGSRIFLGLGGEAKKYSKKNFFCKNAQRRGDC